MILCPVPLNVYTLFIKSLQIPEGEADAKEAQKFINKQTYQTTKTTIY